MKTSEKFMFSGDIGKEHWPEMGYECGAYFLKVKKRVFFVQCLFDFVLMTLLLIFTLSVWCHPFNTYAKLSKKLTFLTPDTHTHVCLRRVRNFSFLENLPTNYINDSYFHEVFC